MEKLVLLVLLLLVVSWIIVLVYFMRFPKMKDGINGVETLKMSPTFIYVLYGSIFTVLMAVVLL